MGTAPIAWAQSCTWNGAAPGDWDNSANWSSCGGGFPNSSSATASISAGQATLTGPESVTAASVSLTGGALQLLGSDDTFGALGNASGSNVYVDNSGTGGSVLTITNSIGSGLLSNAGGLSIGNAGITSATSVSAQSLTNTGTINLTAGAASASLTTASSIADWTGTITVTGQGTGNAEFVDGGTGLTAISSGTVSLVGANAFIGTTGSPASNSGLSNLASNNGNFELSYGATATTSTGLSNTDFVGVDGQGALYGGGGSTLNIGGVLTNSDRVDVGNNGMSGAATLTATGLANSGGTINVQGAGSNLASVTLTNGVGNWTGTLNLDTAGSLGDALFVNGGTGITSIASGGQIEVNGTNAFLATSGNTGSNSALTQLSSNAGNFALHSGAQLTTTTGLDNSQYMSVDGQDIYGGGGSTLNIGGTFTNSGRIDVGNNGMSGAATLTATGLANSGGTINVQGAGSNLASVTLTNGVGNWTGTLNLDTAGSLGDSLFVNGSTAVTSIASGGQIQINGTNAFFATSGNTTSNSALTQLASNAGNFELQSGAQLTTTTGFNNSGYLGIDGQGSVYGGGGSAFTIGGTLTNDTGSRIDVGNNGMGGIAQLSASGFSNAGTVNLVGNGTNVATLTVNGTATNTNTVNIGASSNFDVAGGNSYNQTAGVTTVAANGTLTAPTVTVNGGVMQGTGTVVGNVVNSATVQGGIDEQPGVLTINGNFTNTGAGTVAAYFSGAPSGNTSVTVDNGHGMALQGGTLQANTLNGLSYAAGQSFTVMNFQPGELSGLFSSLQNGNGGLSANPTYLNLGGGLTLGANYNGSLGTVQLQVVNTPTSTAEVWNGGTGNWSTAAGWSSAASPIFYSDVTIGATGSGNVTLDQDGTVNTLAINNGNTLQFDATTNRSLTVGQNVTIASGGALTMAGAAGQEMSVGGTVDNTGTLGIGSGTSANIVNFGGATNAVTNETNGQINVGGNLTAQGAVANNSNATVNMQGGTLSAPSFTNAGSTTGYGTIAPAIANTGSVTASGGTLVAQNGIQGATGNVTVNSGATLDLREATAGSSAATLAVNGNANLGSQNVTVSTAYTNANFGTGNAFNKTAGISGTGQIDAAGNVAQAVAASAGNPSSVSLSGGASAAPTLSFGNVHVDSSTTANYQIENTGTSGPSLIGAIQTGVNGGNITSSALSGTGVTASNYGPVATGANSGPLSVTYAPTVAGALSGQAVHIANNFANVGEQTMAITGAAYAYASPTITSSLGSNNSALNFGVVQVGQTYTDTLNVANTLVAPNAAYQEGLDASFGTISNSQLTGNGSITNLAANTSSNAMSVTLAPTAAGTIGGTVQVNLTSDGKIDGLASTALPSQTLGYDWSLSGTVVNQASPNISPTAIDFGNVRMNSSQQQALTVTNETTSAPQASLDAQIELPTTGAATNNNLTSINQLAAGSSDNTSFVLGLNTASAGHQTGSAQINLQSDSTPNGCTSNCIVDLSPQTVNLQGDVYRLASPVTNTGAVTLAARVGNTSPTQNISVTNSSPDAYTEGLTASLQTPTSTAFTGSGSIANLAAMGTDNSSLNVGLNTGTAGHFTGSVGVNYVSNGIIDNESSNPITLTSGNVTLSGDVYQAATANVGTSAVNFGVVHVGDGGGTLSQGISVSNGAPVAALNDVLTGSVGTSGSSVFSGTGTLGSGLTAGGPASTALQVNLNTNTTAGSYTGSANLSLASHDSELSDLAIATSAISVNAQVNNYASLVFGQTGGSGSLVKNSASAFTLNFGEITQTPGTETANLDITNCPGCDPTFTDLLSSAIQDITGSGFTLDGFAPVDDNSVTDLAGGSSQDGFGISLDTDTLGDFTEMLTLDVESIDPDFDQSIGDVTLTIEGDVTSSVTPPPSVPEPGSLPVLATAFGLFLMLRRYRKGKA